MKATPGGLHYAWVVLGALVVVMLLGSGLRAVFGVFIKPMEATFGWDRAALSGAAAISLLLLGAAGPIVGWLADQWGPRRVIFVSAILLGLGAMLSSRVSALWQIYITCGVLMGLGAGGVGMSTGAALAARWFEARRGLVMGLVGGAMSAGQLVIVPLAVWFTLSYGWRQSFLYLGVLLLVIALPLTLLFIRDDPAQKGLKAYGAGQAARAGEPKAPPEGRTRVADAMQVPAFWLLAGTFFICGYTSNGLVLTHLVPHAAEHGFSEMHAAQALGVMGAMNILGTVASGFICDRYGRKGPLAFYYGVRGLSLLFLLYVWNVPSLHIFAAIFGLNYISTVPPTTTLTANIFGRYSVGSLSGWIFFAHQVGAALGAAVGGWVFQSTGSYSWAFISAALLAFLAVPMALAIKEAPVTRTPEPTPAPAGLPATAS
jgi:MFS family permease